MKPAEPLVSIIMVCHNRPAYAQKAIRSVVGQSFRNWELIVVSNGLAPEAASALRRVARRDQRIKVFHSAEETPIPVSRNRGLELASGELIAVLDDDDAWLPDRLARQVDFLTRPGNARIGVCGSFVYLVDKEDRVMRTKQYPVTHNHCYRALQFRNPFCHSATLIRRRCFEELGGYDERFLYAHDLELWFRFAQRYELANLAECLVNYRVLEDSVTWRNQNEVIDFTLLARQQAVRRYRYPVGPLFHLINGLTRSMKRLPAPFVWKLFNKLIATLNRIGTR